MGALLVDLPDVTVLGVEVDPQVRVHGETLVERPRCGRCGTVARVKDRPVVKPLDLPCFGNPVRLVWRKGRWCCPDEDCEIGSWLEHEPRIAGERQALSDRAGRWACE